MVGSPRVLDRLRRVPPRVWLGLSIAWLAFLCVRTWWQHSLVIEGVRYFWLDDDQMVTMRYARNVVEGHGAVFNPGERVEGYSSPLWLGVMIVSHLFVRDLAVASLPVAGVALVCGALVLVQSERLLAALVDDAPLLRPLLLLPLAAGVDLVFWTAHGFETAAVVLLVTTAFVGVVRGSRFEPYAALALLPLARPDGIVLWSACAACALTIDASIARRVAPLLLVTLVPFCAHLAWRRAYYGEWLPNTYYLKVAHVAGLRPAGQYLVDTLRRYSLVFVFAVVAAVRLRGFVRMLVLTSIAALVIQVLGAGGDTFAWSRLFAPLLPALLIAALLGARSVGTSATSAAVALAVLSMTSASTSAALRDINGQPWSSIVAARLLATHTAPSTRIAVLAAGTIPYFSQRPAVDLLGKTDARIAKLPSHPGARHGHAKYDYALSLASRPDFVITHGARASDELHKSIGRDGFDPYRWDLLEAPAFSLEYVALPDDLIGAKCATYVRRDLVDRVSAWKPLRVGW